MAAGKRAKFMSIFGPIEATVGSCMVAEGKATKISLEETARAEAPVFNEAGADLRFSLAVKGEFVAEFERRVQSAKERVEAHTAENTIKMFYHCAHCMRERPPNQSPREWAQLEVGATPVGIQVWCKRHECNVCHIDFEGFKHPAVLEAG